MPALKRDSGRAALARGPQATPGGKADVAALNKAFMSFSLPGVRGGQNLLLPVPNAPVGQ